jgi:hypothetical protein
MSIVDPGEAIDSISFPGQYLHYFIHFCFIIYICFHYYCMGCTLLHLQKFL